MSKKEFTHVSPDGLPQMVNVSDKKITKLKNKFKNASSEEEREKIKEELLSLSISNNFYERRSYKKREKELNKVMNFCFIFLRIT